MKLSDYVFDFIADLQVKHVFYLPGGGAMHLDDSLGHNSKITPICMLHEQACSISAEAYSRISENYSVCVVTSGPGVTNTITGLAGAWLDGTPVIFISGQAKRGDLVNGQGIRQFGIQEIDVVSLVKSITKYAVQIQKPEDIRYELEKAVALAKNGKPGPVWIDIPLDIQASQINPTELRGYNNEYVIPECSDETITRIIDLFNNAKRPLLLVGNGVRQAKAINEMRELIDTLGIPVMTTWNGVDLIEDNHPLFYGRPGAVGQRHANFIQQNADFVLTIGTRLNLLSTGYDFETFLKKAVHVMVEIDENELHKISVKPTVPVHSDAKLFIDKLLRRKNELNTNKRIEWLDYCSTIKKRYPLFIKEQIPEGKGVNTYSLVDAITNQMTENDIYQFTSSGTGADISMYTFRVKKGQRAFLTKGLASMGFDLPASIGSCLASGKKNTVCVTGDGGFMMNVQELATLRYLNLPVKIFVLDNSGYGMIYNSQSGNFNRLTGCTIESGLPNVDLVKIVNSFGIETEVIDDESQVEEKVQKILNAKKPLVCVVKVFIGQKILPRQTNYKMENGQMASRPLEDMSPLLEREEFLSNLLD